MLARVEARVVPGQVAEPGQGDGQWVVPPAGARAARRAGGAGDLGFCLAPHDTGLLHSHLGGASEGLQDGDREGGGRERGRGREIRMREREGERGRGRGKERERERRWSRKRRGVRA